MKIQSEHLIWHGFVCAALVGLFPISQAHAANDTTNTLLSGHTNLSSTSAWSTGSDNASADDFTIDTTSLSAPATLSFIASANYGSLDDLNSNAVIISNTNASGTVNLTLNHIDSNITPNAAATDVIYVASGASLTLTGTSSAGGTLTVATSSNVSTIDNNGLLTIGSLSDGGAANDLEFTGTGTTTLSGGITNWAGGLAVGSGANVILDGTTSVTHSFGVAGSLTINGSFSDASTNALYEQSGGTITVGSGGNVASEKVDLNFDAGGSTLTIGGGTMIVSGASASLTTAPSSGTGGASTVNLNSGALETSVAITGGSSSTLAVDFNGATYENTAALTDIVSGYTSGQVALNDLAGGAVINTDGNNLGISEALVHDTMSGLDGGLTKQGTGTLTLSGANTYTGATTVSAGTLMAAIAQAGSTGAFGDDSAVVMGTSGAATLDLNNYDETIGSLSGGVGANGNVTLGSGTLTTGGDNTSVTYAGIISGSGGLTKTGTGTQTLSGMNTYLGPTMVSGGTLAVQGSLSGSSALTVAANGTAAGNLAVGQAAGASSVGSQTVSTLTLVSAGGGGPSTNNEPVLSLYLAGGTSSDSLASTGTLTLTGLTFELNLTGASTGDYTLLTWLNSGSTPITTSNIDLLLNGVDEGTGSSDLSITQGTTDSLIFDASVPEPSTWILMIAGLAFLTSRMRRKLLSC